MKALYLKFLEALNHVTTILDQKKAKRMKSYFNFKTSQARKKTTLVSKN